MCGRNFSIISKTEILHYTSWNTFKYIFKLTKDRFLLKIKTLRIYLYFMGTKYLWSNALVQYIDYWTQA